MATPGWINRLASRWNLKNTAQVIMVLVVFACTGFTVMFIKKPIMTLVAGEGGNTALASVLYYIFIFPLYNVVLLFFGFVFGQFSFFWEFEKRTFRRIVSLLKRK
jgi:riboflavin transporter FmnP